MKNGTLCDKRYHALEEAFQENFVSRGDVGAALSVVKDGELVVNLWTGFRDANHHLPWEESSLTNIWSTTKGVVAACAALLVDRGQLDYERPVSYYWPDFAVNGKEQVTVRMLLSHQAGLCGFIEPVKLDMLYDESQAARRLGAMTPIWAPGDGCGYHAISVGFLLNELFLRSDGRSIKQFFEQELCEAHDLDIHIGLEPESYAYAATMLAAPLTSESVMGEELSSAQRAALTNPPMSPELPNTAAWRTAQIPAANGFATACSLAELYGALANEGRLGGKLLVSPSTIANATATAVAGFDRVLSMEVHWAAGFMRNIHGLYGPSNSAFGHSGWGGSFAFADPERRLGVAYVMNNMGAELTGDPRNEAIIDALYAC